MDNKLAISNFVRRQTPESPYTHFAGTDEELLAVTKSSLEAFGGDFSAYVTKGYRDGVKLVSVDPSKFYTGMVELQAGDELTGKFESRVPGEEPRITIRKKKLPGNNKQPAKAVQVVLYSHAVLAEDGAGETGADWEIISLNGYPTAELAPIDPFTLMHNHFQSDGGTATNMTAEEFEAALRKSFEYHKNKALLDSCGD